MAVPYKTLSLNYNGQTLSVNIYLDLDKIEGFTYYTFEFDENIRVVLSKFDGQEWRIANTILSKHLIEMLGKLLD